MTVVDLGLLGTGSSKAAATTLAVTNTTGAVIPAGTLIHITGCWDNIASVTAPTITSSTIGGATATANHATAIGSGITTTAGSGVWHQCFRALTTASIAIGAVICTLTSNQSAVARAAHAVGWSGAQNALRGTVATGVSITGAPTVQTAGTALVTGDLVIGSASFENNAQMTGDADTLNGSWSAVVGTFTTGGGAATNVGTASQFKVITATGVQSFDPTGGVADTIACVYSLQPLPDPTITQAVYRIYADGTETGSVALAAQDTSYPVDLSNGDVNLLVRTLLQSTNTTALPVTDDWQLQWEKNASGIWIPVSSTEALTDASSPTSASSTGLSTGTLGVGQSFMGNGQKLSRVGFRISKTGVPPGDIVAQVYAHTGTFGTLTGMGTGPVLASSTSRVATSFQTSTQWEYFVFDSTFTLAAGTPYVIIAAALTAGTGTDHVNVNHVIGQSSHPGITVGRFDSGGWYVNGLTYDTSFELYTASSVAIPFNSANLTDGAATTNRLTGGTGTFQAGKISEDGLVDNLGWSGNNFTEVLYALTVKQPDLANGDTVRFRVLRNGATAGFTYTQTPTISVIKTTYPPTTLVRSGRGAAASFLDVDVTGGRLLFVVRNATSTSLVTDNAGVVLLAEDTTGPRRNSVWRVAQGTTGVVRITGSSTALWGYCLVSWPDQAASADYIGSNTTADMGAGSLAVSPAAQVVVFWNTDSAADWGAPPTDYTVLDKVTTQNAEPSWLLACSNVNVAGLYSTPTMSRGKEGTSLTELIASVAVTPLNPKIATFTDDFTAGISATNWNSSGTTASAGQVSLAINSGIYASIDTNTKRRFDLKDSSVFMQWVSLPTFGASNECFLEMITDASNSISVYRSGSNSGVTLRTKVGGVSTTIAGTNTDSWWRLRESGGNVYLDTSPDGTTWTQLLTKAHTLTTQQLASMYLNINAGDYGSLGAKTVVIDNVNVSQISATGRPKIWTGAAWVRKPLKVWTGSAWVEKPMKVWTGSAWKTLT
jgi:hypothetical protein